MMLSFLCFTPRETLLELLPSRFFEFQLAFNLPRLARVVLSVEELIKIEAYKVRLSMFQEHAGCKRQS